MYRVLTRQDGHREWRAATPPTSNWKAAQVALDRVRRFFADGLLVEANTADELARRVEYYCHLDTHIARAADTSATTFPKSSDASAEVLDARRWELERGPGGDHDAPYVFTLPTSLATLRVWGRLLAQTQAELHLIEIEHEASRVSHA